MAAVVEAAAAVRRDWVGAEVWRQRCEGHGPQTGTTPLTVRAMALPWLRREPPPRPWPRSPPRHTRVRCCRCLVRLSLGRGWAPQCLQRVVACGAAAWTATTVGAGLMAGTTVGLVLAVAACR